jgi:hypothetical protein
MIGLADETGAKVAGLTFDNCGSPSLMLTDRRGEEQVRLLGPVPEVGGSVIGIQDKQRKLRAFWSVDAQGEPMIGIADENFGRVKLKGLTLTHVLSLYRKKLDSELAPRSSTTCT